MAFDTDKSFLSQEGGKASALTLASKLASSNSQQLPPIRCTCNLTALCVDPALPPGPLTLSTQLRTTSSVQSMLHVGEVLDALLKSTSENQTPVCLVFPPAASLCLFSLLGNTLHQNPAGNTPWSSNTPNGGQRPSVRGCPNKQYRHPAPYYAASKKDREDKVLLCRMLSMQHHHVHTRVISHKRKGEGAWKAGSSQQTLVRLSSRLNPVRTLIF